MNAWLFPTPGNAQLFPLPRWASIGHFPLNGRGTEMSFPYSRPQHINKLPFTCTALLSYTVTPSLLGWQLRRRKSFSRPSRSWQIYDLVIFATALGTTLSRPMLMSQAAESTTQISLWKCSLIEGGNKEEEEKGDIKVRIWGHKTPGFHVIIFMAIFPTTGTLG